MCLIHVNIHKWKASMIVLFSLDVQKFLFFFFVSSHQLNKVKYYISEVLIFIINALWLLLVIVSILGESSWKMFSFCFLLNIFLNASLKLACLSLKKLFFVLFRHFIAEESKLCGPSGRAKLFCWGWDGVVQQQIVHRTPVTGSPEGLGCSAGPKSAWSQMQPKLLQQSQTKSGRLEAQTSWACCSMPVVLNLQTALGRMD